MSTPKYTFEELINDQRHYKIANLINSIHFQARMKGLISEKMNSYANKYHIDQFDTTTWDNKYKELVGESLKCIEKLNKSKDKIAQHIYELNILRIS